MNTKIVRVIANRTAIKAALQAGKTRPRMYPADYAALEAITTVLRERIELGKKLHTLKITQIMSIGYSGKTAKNAIRKLRDAGIIKVVISHKFNPATGATFAGLYAINPDFLMEQTPNNLEDLWNTYYGMGGSGESFDIFENLVREEFGHVNVELLSEALAKNVDALNESRIKRAKYGAVVKMQGSKS